jgi:outer membrane protein assembly factor BamB
MNTIKLKICETAQRSSLRAPFAQQRRFCYAFSSLVLIALLVSACQPMVVATETPTTAPSPTASPTALPTASPIPTTVSTPEAVWTYKTGGAIWGTPAISNGTVYFGSDDGNLYAVDSQKGDLKWKFPSQGIIRSRPSIFGGLVYFASDDGNLYAVDAQGGAQAWRTDIGNYLRRDGRKLGTSNDPTGCDYMQSSPVVGNGQIYIGSLDGNVYAIAADTGKINWTFKTGQKVRATPTLADGVLYVGSWDKSTYALNALTGQVRWKTLPIGGEVQTTALVANGLVYTASRKASVVALDAQTGEEKWEFDYGLNMWVESSPQLVGNVIYIGSSGSEVVWGLDSQTGKPITYFNSRAFNWSTPAIVDNILYIGGTNFKTEENKGGLFALKLEDGKISDPDREYWLFPVPERETLENNWSGVASSPVVQNGIIYFGGLDGNFYAISIVP